MQWSDRTSVEACLFDAIAILEPPGISHRVYDAFCQAS